MVKGMKTKYRKNQDLDFGLRLAKYGVRLLRFSDAIAIHHTISYLDKKRVLNSIKSGDWLFKGVLYRDHIMNCEIIKMVLREDYSACLMFCSILLSFFSFYQWIAYVLILSTRVYFHRKQKKKYFFTRLLNRLVNDIGRIISFILYFPRSCNFSYIKIS